MCVFAGVQDSEALEEEAWKVSTKMMSLHIRGAGLLQLLCLENGPIGSMVMWRLENLSSKWSSQLGACLPMLCLLQFFATIGVSTDIVLYLSGVIGVSDKHFLDGCQWNTTACVDGIIV